MLIGEKPPACTPWITISPIRSGLIWYWTAKPRAIGAMMATALGLTAPTAVSTAASRNMIHGIAPIRPRTARTASSTSQSTVPLFWATANRNVIPTRVRNRSLGNLPMMWR
jgi:hypothetical protein